MKTFDILIIGGGAAGIAAAKGAYDAGCRSIAIIDRKKALGGVLLQCLHHGFGQNQNGPEYLNTLLENFPRGVSFFGNTTVLSVAENRIALLSGGESIQFQQLILATGCREIPMGALPIVGTRPEGVYNAGQMQEMMNLHGITPEGPVVILGSGDLGLVMAKHLAEVGLDVTLVEKKSICGGMARNQRCLREWPIRLICNATVDEVLGEEKLRGCILSTGETLPCKTLLIAAGLIPDRELITDLRNAGWLHICGNCNRVHPMIEAVIKEGYTAGKEAVLQIGGNI
jgi:NADPH-dependent 2,4-dienoyl-CoA reductase/sulfur reductase-like enzyme